MESAPVSRPARRWHMIDEIDLMPLVREHHSWSRLCERLEGMADRLPQWPSVIEAAALRIQLGEAIPLDGSQELRLVELTDDQNARWESGDCLARVVERRMALTVQAQDVTEMLGGTESQTDPRVLGYTLRNVWETCRELMTAELFGLMIVARRRLTPSAKALIAHRLHDLRRVSRPRP